MKIEAWDGLQRRSAAQFAGEPHAFPVRCGALLAVAGARRALMLLQLPPDARRLADYMSDLSEVAYCAGWMRGLEYALWQAVLLGPRSFGRLHITAEQIERLQTLSAAAGGWIVFDDTQEEHLVTHDQWKQLFQKWSEANPGLAD